jgi:outer membrane protein assembly factor BamD
MNKAYYIYILFLVFFALGNKAYLGAKPIDFVKQSPILQKKEQAVQLYERKRYAKANELIEELLPLIKNRMERSELQFYQAYCSFYEKDYLVSSNQFHLFVKQYPFSLQIEEAIFMRGYSLACISVDTRLDQTTTYDAIYCLERYLANYPTGSYVDKATSALQNLQERLVKKSFEAAHLYFRLGYYNAAVTALKNLEEAYPNSLFKEQVLLLLVKSYQKLAMGTSNEEEQKETIAHVKQFSESLSQYVKTKQLQELKDKGEKGKEKRAL